MSFRKVIKILSNNSSDSLQATAVTRVTTTECLTGHYMRYNRLKEFDIIHKCKLA